MGNSAGNASAHLDGTGSGGTGDDGADTACAGRAGAGRAGAGRDGTPSQTALTAAAARAAHLIVDGEPVIFADGLAATLLGELAAGLIAFHRDHGSHPVLAGARAQVVVRSRYTEDCLARSAARGITQYVILGAGLDSFGYRSALARQVRVFEVDHPVTLAWKREALARAGIEVPGTVRHVAADLETGSLTEPLQRAGFELARPALISWLGVTMYLTSQAIGRTLAAASRFAPGTELIADHMLPAGLRDADGDSYVSQVAPVAAGRGEPWRTFLAPGDMAALLAGHGFAVAEQPGQREAIGAALWERRDALRPARLSVLTRAVLTGPAVTGRAPSGTLR